MKYFIYKHNLNGKSYIGYTCMSVEERLQKHIDDSERGKPWHFHRAIAVYGKDNITTEILEEGELDSIKDIGKREIYWISKYDTYNTGYNMTKGGEGGDATSNHPNRDEIIEKVRQAGMGRKHTEESKKKMSEKALLRPPVSEETKKKIGDANRGRKHSDETKKKLSELGKKKVFTEEYRKKLSDNAKNRPIVKCPHCGKEGVHNSMQRWHFNNCKER